jgi:uncharacterized ion transporter superfamily protein YfcC|tara:strand:+ start:193 stop:405 length:213 start_codon:yes stop_codon:yes gene_type:complete
MIISIIIFTTIFIFVFSYTIRLKKDNNKIIQNLDNYDEKKKIKQQKPKVLGQKQIKGKSDQKKRTRMYHI